MKTNQIYPSGVTDDKSVGRCENLRRTTDNALKPVGTPAHIADQGWTPYHRYFHTDGSYSDLFCNGRTLRIINGSHVDEITLIEVPLSALTTPDGILFMYANGACLLHCSEATGGGDAHWVWELTDTLDMKSPLALVAVDCHETRYVHTDDYILANPLRLNGSKLSNTDRSAFSDILRDAYVRLDAACAADGCYFQPMLGRYRLLDGRGRVLYESAPSMLVSSGGFNLTNYFSTALIHGYIDDSSDLYHKVINSASLTAHPYQVALRFISDPSASLLWSQVASIEVSLSPQFHPIDFSEDIEYSIERPTSGNSVLSFFMPGASSGFVSNPMRYTKDVKMAMQHLDKALEPAGRIDATALQSLTVGQHHYPSIVSNHSVKQDIKRLKSIISSPVATDSNTAEAAIMEQCRMPHSFRATAVGAGGSTVVWGNVSPRLFKGYRVTEMMRDFTPGLATDVAVTDIAGGHQRVVCSDSATGLSPTTLSPLLCYPLRAATSLTIMAEGSDIGIRRREFPLESIPGCDFAFYLEPTLAPIPLDEWEEIPVIGLPAERRDDTSFPGSVITADVLSPLSPKGVALASSAPITAVMPATRDVSGWNFAHLRFYLLGAEGTMLISVNPPNEPYRTVLLDSRPYSGSAFHGPDGIYIVAGGDLIHFAGGKAVTRIREVRAAGYCRTFDEVWVIPADSASPLRIYTSDLTEYYTRPTISAKALYTVGGNLYLLTASDTLLDTSRELSIPINVAWSKRWRLDSRRPRVGSVTSMMHASQAKGRVALTADFGPSEAIRTVLALDLDGAIDAPLSARFLTPPRPWYTYSFDMRVSPDFRFYSLLLS